MLIARVMLLSLIGVLLTDRAVAQYEPYGTRRAEPTAWEKFDAGTKRFFADTAAGTKRVLVDTGEGTKRFFVKTGEGTKRLFTGAKDALTWNKPAPKPSAAAWSPSGRYLRPKKKESWLGSLFRREEPRPSKSLADFMSAPRLDP